MSSVLHRQRQLVDQLQALEALSRERRLTVEESRKLEKLEARRRRNIYARQATIARAQESLRILTALEVRHV